MLSHGRNHRTVDRDYRSRTVGDMEFRTNAAGTYCSTQPLNTDPWAPQLLVPKMEARHSKTRLPPVHPFKVNLCGRGLHGREEADLSEMRTVVSLLVSVCLVAVVVSIPAHPDKESGKMARSGMGKTCFTVHHKISVAYIMSEQMPTPTLQSRT